MKHAWLGIGGNIGDVQSTMAQALQMLDDLDSTDILSVSAIYETPPWGLTDQPWFLNCCAEISTNLSPEELLEACQRAERAGKRERIQRWGPRTIDVDILVYEGLEQTEHRLTIPHPRMLERAFVLVPLAEISPKLMLEGLSSEVRAENIDADGVERVDGDPDWWRTKPVSARGD